MGSRPAGRKPVKASPPAIESRGERNIRWIEAHCRIPEGKFVNRPVVLRPWQRDVIRGIYDTPTRTAIVSFGRKNAKTTLSAFLLLLHLCGPEARQNAQLVSAAQSKDQAGVLFKLAAKIVRLSPTLSAYVHIRDHVKELFCAELGTLYAALSAEVKTAFGLSPVFAVHDELGQVRGPRSELYEAVETAAGAHDDPLSIVISTQAPNDADLLSVLIDDALSGADPMVKVFLYTAPEELDPFGEEALRAANPAFGDFLNADEVRKQQAAAKRMPSAEAGFRNLILNQRVSQTSTLIPRTVWKACDAAPDDDVFRRMPCYIALDLSARNDLTALVLIARDEEGVWHVRPEFYAPAAGLSERAHRDRVPYDVWRDMGFLIVTPGASVQYEPIAERLCELCDDFNVVQIGFDRWRVDVLQSELARIGRTLPMAPFGQGFKDMSPAIDALEAELLNVKIRHGSHPVLNWNANNAIVVKDSAGNRKLDKSKVTGRIDGIVALAMALGVAGKAEQPLVMPDDYELLVA